MKILRTVRGLHLSSERGEVRRLDSPADDCWKPIPNGKAHIRTRIFAQVAYCGDCGAMRKGATVLRRVV